MFSFHLVLDLRQNCFGILMTSHRLEPAWRFRQRLARVPNAQCANSTEHEHCSPAHRGNQHESNQSRYRQSRDDEYGHQSLHLAARRRRSKLGERGISHDVLRAKPEAHHEPERDKDQHVRRHRSAQRRNAEDHEVGLVREATAETIAEETGGQRAEHHPEERQRHKQRILAERREAALQRGAEDRRGDVDIEAIEEHADPDQPHDAFVEARYRKPVQTCACIHIHFSLLQTFVGLSSCITDYFSAISRNAETVRVSVAHRKLCSSELSSAVWKKDLHWRAPVSSSARIRSASASASACNVSGAQTRVTRPAFNAVSGVIASPKRTIGNTCFGKVYRPR